MAEQKETVILEFDIDESDAIESINSLTKANKELRAERNALNLQSEQGKKRATEINALLDQNTNKIKTNVSALEKQKINIGNYKSALDGVHPALGKVGEGLEAGASGFKAMTLQALRFIATPIGAILAAIVAVFTLLKTALSENDALMDKFEDVTKAVSVVLDVLISRVAKLGEALVALFEGDFDRAIDLTAQSFSGLAAEIGAAVKQQQLFLNASRKLTDDTRNLNIEIARTENQLKLLDKASKNVNLTFDEQEELVRKAIALNENLVKQKEDLARRDLVITARQLRVAKEFQQQSNENFDQYVKRLLDSSALGDKEKDKLAEKIIALENARGASLDDQAKRENALAAIEEKRTAALEKQTKALGDNTDARAARIAALEREQRGERTDPLQDAFDTTVKVETDLTSLMKDQLAERQKNLSDYYTKAAADAEKAAQLEVQAERDKMIAVTAFIHNLQQVAHQDTVAFKALATAQALINTYAAANAAFKSGSSINIAFGIISAAAAVAAGLANVARINNVQFAEGGVVLRGPSHAQGGIPIEAEGNEIILTKGVYNNPSLRAAASAINVAGGGRRFADGGLVSGSLSAPIDQQLALANIVKNIGPFEVSAVEVTKVQKRVAVKEKISRR